MNSIVEAVAKHALNRPTKFCIADGKKELTYKEYWECIRGYAAYLKKIGIKKGECVVVRNSQNVEFVTVGMAVQLIGAIFVPLEKNVAEQRIREICEEVEAKLYVANREIDLGIPFASCVDVLTYRSESEREEFTFPGRMDTAEILFTTGTTGKSKGIELLHKNVVAVAENVISGVEMKENNVELIPVPLSHSHGLRRYYANLLNGSGVVILDGVVFVKNVFACMKRYGVTAIDLVPAALSALLKLGAEELEAYSDKIDYVQLGSAPIPEQDKKRICKILPNARLYNFYGTTESGCSCIIDFNRCSDKKNCIGHPTCHAVFAFFDENGNRLESSKENVGLLACKGDMNMKGYYRLPTSDEQIFRQGYIVTQDMAYMDEDGLIYLVGRAGDVIQSGGNKISPQEVEEVALDFDGVEECACIPVENPLLGQEPKLFYATQSGVDVKEEALYEFIKSKLEAYKVPKLIEKIDRIPRTYNGKINRRQLVEQEKGD
nr:acyl--CoA ligase [Lachnospiraceae bacterium]